MELKDILPAFIPILVAVDAIGSPPIFITLTNAVMPLGMPLIAGPAVLTTSMVIVSQYGLAITFISVVVNIALAGIILSSAATVMKFLGEAGSRAFSKIISLLLAAIAIMLAIKGIGKIF